MNVTVCTELRIRSSNFEENYNVMAMIKMRSSSKKVVLLEVYLHREQGKARHLYGVKSPAVNGQRSICDHITIFNWIKKFGLLNTCLPVMPISFYPQRVPSTLPRRTSRSSRPSEWLAFQVCSFLTAAAARTINASTICCGCP